MNDETVQSVLKYSEKYIYEKVTSTKILYSEKHSFAKWAVDELLKIIIDSPFDPIDEIVENFIIKMTFYSMYSENQAIYFRFNLASDIAEDILNYLRENNQKESFNE